MGADFVFGFIQTMDGEKVVNYTTVCLRVQIQSFVSLHFLKEDHN